MTFQQLFDLLASLRQLLRALTGASHSLSLSCLSGHFCWDSNV